MHNNARGVHAIACRCNSHDDLVWDKDITSPAQGIWSLACHRACLSHSKARALAQWAGVQI